MRQQTIHAVEVFRLVSMSKIQHGTKGSDASGTVLVGCAGWAQISGAKHLSEMNGSQLERYASVFPAVEINSSFYRAHRQTTYRRWADSVPAAFRFSVKLPRTITHSLRLQHVDALLTQFQEETAGLGEKLGCVLVQLPPSLQFDATVADSFFRKMRSIFQCMVACEARHASWFGAEASAVLEKYAITRVRADPPVGNPGPHEPTTADAYMRLHGSPRIYYSSYSDTYLAKLAEELAAHARQHKHTWLIFDNTASGAALPNALAVLELVQNPLTKKRG